MTLKDVGFATIQYSGHALRASILSIVTIGLGNRVLRVINPSYMEKVEESSWPGFLPDSWEKLKTAALHTMTLSAASTGIHFGLNQIAQRFAPLSFLKAGQNALAILVTATAVLTLLVVKNS